MKTKSFLLTLALLLGCFLSLAKAQPFNTLYSFTGQSDGSYPQSSLILAGNLLFGTASSGGNAGVSGSIFAVDSRGILTNLYQGGTDFTNVYDFAAGETNSAGLYTNSDGAVPAGSLVLAGNTLFGTTSTGGTTGYGTVFSVNTNGTSFKVLHTFTNGTDGGTPLAGLVLAGNTLFGTASQGGASGKGVVFSLNTNGTGFASLYPFTGHGDGSHPQANLVLSGATLYGTALGSGGTATGVVFSLATNGGNFVPLHQFSTLAASNTVGVAVNTDGAFPVGGVILSGGILYGTTEAGGNGYGTVFSLTTSGTGFTTLYAFTNGADGAGPLGGVALSGGVLFGTTSAGVNNNYQYALLNTNGFGTVFSISTNGTNFNSLYAFTGGLDGIDPAASLIVSGGNLYGTAVLGGSDPNIGSVFTLGTSARRLTTLLSLNANPANGPDGQIIQASVILAGNSLYGTALAGGAGNGSIFTLLTNGTGGIDGTSEIGFGQYSFSTASAGFIDNINVGLNSDGQAPAGALVLSGSTLYGTASVGGTSGFGTVFALNTNYFVNNNGFATLYAFTNGGDGSWPEAGLILSGNTLYGTTSGTAAQGGTNYGSVFAINTNGAGFKTLHNFSKVNNNLDNSDGATPMARLALAGGTLYGTASGGGANSYGTIFSVSTSGTGFATLHNFAGSDGYWPEAGVVVAGNTLYGTTSRGGAYGGGTVFSLNLNTTTFLTLYHFTAELDGSRPMADLLLSGGTLYGTTYGYGITVGSIFSINTNGSGFTTLYDFAGGSDGIEPQAGLLLSGNILYGSAISGGFFINCGTVFALNLTPPNASSVSVPIPLNIQISGKNVILSWNDPAGLFSLQASPVVNGIYATVPAAASPFTTAIAGTAQFFRLQAPH